MYDWELQKYISDKYGCLSSIEYLYICQTCPQLREIKFDPFQNKFKAWSDDGGYFEFSVYYEK